MGRQKWIIELWQPSDLERGVELPLPPQHLGLWGLQQEALQAASRLLKEAMAVRLLSEVNGVNVYQDLATDIHGHNKTQLRRAKRWTLPRTKYT